MATNKKPAKKAAPNKAKAVKAAPKKAAKVAKGAPKKAAKPVKPAKTAKPEASKKRCSEESQIRTGETPACPCKKGGA